MRSTEKRFLYDNVYSKISNTQYAIPFKKTSLIHAVWQQSKHNKCLCSLFIRFYILHAKNYNQTYKKKHCTNMAKGKSTEIELKWNATKRIPQKVAGQQPKKINELAILKKAMCVWFIWVHLFIQSFMLLVRCCSWPNDIDFVYSHRLISLKYRMQYAVCWQWPCTDNFAQKLSVQNLCGFVDSFFLLLLYIKWTLLF